MVNRQPAGAADSKGGEFAPSTVGKSNIPTPRSAKEKVSAQGKKENSESLNLRLEIVRSSTHPLFQYLPESQKETILKAENKLANQENKARDARVKIVDINWRIQAEVEGKEIAQKYAKEFASSDVEEIGGLVGFDTYEKTVLAARDLLEENVREYVDRIVKLMIQENPKQITDERIEGILRKDIREEYCRSSYYQDALASRDGIIRGAEQIYLDRNPNYKI